jgi:4-hydroxy-3-polyprenylbenzoate decarboxylase
LNESQSIRPFLEMLRAQDALLQLDDEVDPHFELSALLSLTDPHHALLCSAMRGSPLRAVGNVLTSRARVAQALGIRPQDIVPRIHAAIRNPVLPVPIEGAAPVQQIVTQDAPLATLPIPTFFEDEERPYVTAGVIIARDPETGRGNASFARLGKLSDNTALIGIAPNHHLALFARRAAALGRPLEIAVILGAHPAIQLAACLYLGVGDYELECAGALLGTPVRVAPAKTVALNVPAEAEIVLEGRIYPDKPVEEGLISEYHGMYEAYGPGLLVEFSAMTRREDAIYQAIEPGYHHEHIFLGALPIAASLRNALGGILPNVLDVAVTPAGAGRTDIVVQIDQPRPGQARRAMMAAFAAVSMVKRVTVVDADIDPWDAGQVEWARVNRMKYERDLLLLPLSGTDRSEPMEDGGLVTKLGMDATAKAGDRVEGVKVARPPADVLERARDRLAQIGYTSSPA